MYMTCSTGKVFCFKPATNKQTTQLPDSSTLLLVYGLTSLHVDMSAVLLQASMASSAQGITTIAMLLAS